MMIEVWRKVVVYDGIGKWWLFMMIMVLQLFMIVMVRR